MGNPGFYHMSRLLRFGPTFLSIILAFESQSIRAEADFRPIWRGEATTYLARPLEIGASNPIFVGVDIVLLGPDLRALNWKVQVVNCQAPRSVAIAMVGFNNADKSSMTPEWSFARVEGVGQSFRPEDLHFDPIADESTVRRKVPNPLLAVTEFACEAASRPTQVEEVAIEVLRTGGINGLSDLICNIDGPNGKTSSSNLRFIEADQYLQFGGVWRLQSFVEKFALGFKVDGVELRVDRRTGKVQMSLDKTGSVWSGQCEASATATRKF